MAKRIKQTPQITDDMYKKMCCDLIMQDETHVMKFVYNVVATICDENRKSTEDIDRYSSMRMLFDLTGAELSNTYLWVRAAYDNALERSKKRA